MFYTYKITHPSGIFYFGYTTNRRLRVNRHKTSLNCNKHHAEKLQHAYNVDPTLNWEFYECSSKEDAHAAEVLLIIANKDNPNLANTVFAGVPQSVVTRERRSASMRKIVKSPEWERARSEGIKNSDKSKLQRIKLHAAIRKRVNIEGVEYPSLTDAATKNEISLATAYRRIKSKAALWNQWNYVSE